MFSLMFSNSLCFLYGSKVSELDLAWSMTWGRWSLRIEATGAPAASGVRGDPGSLVLDGNLQSGLPKAQGRLELWRL